MVATLGGIVVPTAVAFAAALWLRSGHPGGRSGWPAILVVPLIAAALTALLAQTAWPWAGLPGAGLSEFLPHRWLRRRWAAREAGLLLQRLEALPAVPSTEAEELLVDLAEAFSASDPYTRGQPARRARLCTEIGRAYGLSEPQLHAAHLAAVLHDLGMARIPAPLIHARGPLAAEDAEQVWLHPERGARLVAPYVSPDVAAAVRSHHERRDGRGYPDGRAGGDIPGLASLLAVVDTYVALITDRAYRRGRSPRRAFDELRAAGGAQLDAGLVETLIALESTRADRGLGAWFHGTGGALRGAEHWLRGSPLPSAAVLSVLLVAGAAVAGPPMAGIAAPAAATRPAPVPSASPTPTPQATAAALVPTPQATPPASPPRAAPSSTPGPPASPPSPRATHARAATAPGLTPVATAAPTAPAGASTSPQAFLPVPRVPIVRVILNPSPTAPDSPTPVTSPTPGPTTDPGRRPTPAQPTPGPSPAPGAPAVTGVSPGTGPSPGGTVVAITGSGFSGATAVTFGGADAWGFSVHSDGSITAVSPGGHGSVDVVVITPAGSSGTGSGGAARFLYQP